MFGAVTVKKGREKKLRNGYPWVQRGELASAEGEDGSLVRVSDMDGAVVGIGTYNSLSRFPVRMLSMNEEEITQDWFTEKFRAANDIRDRLITGTNSWRVLSSEADGVGGLIIDKFGPHYVFQVRSLGMEKLRPIWYPAFMEMYQPESVMERSDMAGRKEEGLEPVAKMRHGNVPVTAEVEEDGFVYTAPLLDGLKTGFYLDQRETRRQFAARVQPGEKVLDLFCYTGTFALRAALAGAEPVAVDILKPAIIAARMDAERYKLNYPIVEANAFEFLEEGPLGPYDWILIDPPAIAKTADKRDSLKWAIWKLVHGAIPHLKVGGRIIVCACTYQMGLINLLETCRLAASDRGARFTLENVTYQDVDHPMPLGFPESAYLKCAWLRRDA